MKKTEQAVVIGCVTALAEVFNRKLSPPAVKAYGMGLRGLSEEQIQFATDRALQTCHFMPSPAELRELVYGRVEDRAVKAWAAVEIAVRRYGHVRSVSFDDPVIHATIRALGGWQSICTMPTREFDSFVQKKFLDCYAALCRSGISAEQGEPLLGWADEQNGLLGYAMRPPQRISTGLPTQPVALPPPATKSLAGRAVPRLELQKP
jgi:hypothetical protein